MKGDAANESQYNHLPESAARQHLKVNPIANPTVGVTLGIY